MLKRIWALVLVSATACAPGVAQLSTQSQAAPISEYHLTDVSHSFDFVVRMQAQTSDGLDSYREGPGTLLIFRKGALTPIQTIALENIFVSLDEGGQPLRNTAHLYDDQGLINVGDFNFDGYDDFAIQVGNSGSYGSPSYDVYLYDPSQKSFKISQPMSELIEETLGFSVWIASRSAWSL